MIFPRIKGKSGFTLMEIMISILLTSILVSASLKIFQSQVVLFHRAQVNTEVHENLRIAADWLTRDIIRAEKIEKCGTGNSFENALIIGIEKLDDEKYRKVAYFYGTNSDPTVFYRAYDEDGDNDYQYQPLTVPGYIRGWSVKYFDPTRPPGDEWTDSTTNTNKVRQIEFKLTGGYKNMPDKYITSSVYIRTVQ